MNVCSICNKALSVGTWLNHVVTEHPSALQPAFTEGENK